MMQADQNKKLSIQEIFAKIVQAVSPSFEWMKQKWKQGLEEVSINPKATYQKPLNHHPKTELGILYEPLKNEQKPVLKSQQSLEEKIYSPSPTAKKLAYNNANPPRNTLYEVNYHNNKTKLFYESPAVRDKQTLEYPKPLNVGYHSR